MRNTEELFDEIDRLRRRNKNILYCGVYCNGHQIADQWFATCGREEPMPVYSVTKTVTALLVGQAITQGAIESVEVPVRQLLPEYGQLMPEELRLKHLLTMTAGYHWPEIAEFGNRNNVFSLFKEAEDPLRFVFTRDRDAAPGAAYCYNSGISHAMMGILNERVGNPVVFAEEVLWKPLGISSSHVDWVLDRKGLPYGGHGLRLTAEGMNRLGRMLLFKGMVSEKPVIAQEYIADMTRCWVDDVRGYKGYGYQTWLGTVEGYDFFGAFGHGGQRIYVFPHLGMSVTFLGKGVYPEFGLQERVLRRWINSWQK